MATPTLSDAAITEALEMIDGWKRDGDKIIKTFEVGTYPQGLAFATAAGMVADGMNHHPEDFSIGWKKVTISFTTHDAGSKITQKDVDAAKAINKIGIRT